MANLLQLKYKLRNDQKMSLFTFLKKSKTQDKLLAYGLLMPVILIVLGVIIIPELIAMGMAFINYYLGVDTIEWRGLENFERILRDPNFLNSVKVNLIFVVGVVAIEMSAGIFLGVHMAKKFEYQRLWIALIMSPVALTPAVVLTMWKYILSFQVGIVNYFIEVVGFDRINFMSKENALLTLIIIGAWAGIPHVFMFVYPARTTIPQDLYEAGAIDGASGWSMFRYITLPLLQPAILVALIFRVIFTIRVWGLAWLLAQGGPQRSTELLAVYLYKEGFVYNRLFSAAAVSWLILLLTVLLASAQIYRMYQNTFVKSVSY